MQHNAMNNFSAAQFLGQLPDSTELEISLAVERGIAALENDMQPEDEMSPRKVHHLPFVQETVVSCSPFAIDDVGACRTDSTGLEGAIRHLKVLAFNAKVTPNLPQDLTYHCKAAYGGLLGNLQALLGTPWGIDEVSASAFDKAGFLVGYDRSKKIITVKVGHRMVTVSNMY